MAKIAVDIDSTLYDFSTPAREGFLKLAAERDDASLKRGAYHAWTEWRSPADACGSDVWMEVIALCHDNDVILDRTPFPGAVETCQALAQEGHELLYISNRAVESAEATDQWLRKWEFPLSDDDHELVCMMEDKRPYLEDCQYIIDDRPKTVIDFIYDYEYESDLRAGAARYAVSHRECCGPTDAATEQAAYDQYISRHSRRAFVLSYPYNQNLTDIPHLYLAPTWAGLNDYLVGKGVLSKPAYLALT